MKEDKTYELPADGGKEQEASYGKFKTAEELLKAYNSLQSEFTKRSQKLAEYEQKKIETEKWEGRVAEFVAKYPVAERYADEIAQEIAKNENGANGEANLESALLNVLVAKVKTPEQMAADDDVIEKVLNADANREKIIAQYLDTVKSNPYPVTLQKGGAIPLTPPIRPRNIREAGELALKIINT